MTATLGLPLPLSADGWQGPERGEGSSQGSRGPPRSSRTTQAQPCRWPLHLRLNAAPYVRLHAEGVRSHFTLTTRVQSRGILWPGSRPLSGQAASQLAFQWTGQMAGGPLACANLRGCRGFRLCPGSASRGPHSRPPPPAHRLSGCRWARVCHQTRHTSHFPGILDGGLPGLPEPRLRLLQGGPHLCTGRGAPSMGASLSPGGHVCSCGCRLCILWRSPGLTSLIT